MIEISVEDVVDITGGTLECGGAADIKKFCTDTRDIVPGSYFIAIKGRNFDGNDFILDALEKGASGVITERKGALAVPAGKTVISVPDTREAMASIASALRSRTGAVVVCITGTNGKTTTKEILSHVLSSKYKVLKSRKSFNNIIGLSLTFFDLEEDHEVIVLETGTNHPGEIAELASIARPHAAVITNIGDGHLEFFRDRQGVFLEKICLLDLLPKNGISFLNKDDEFLSKVHECGFAVRSFGRDPGSDIHITAVERAAEGYSFLLNGEKYDLPLEGEHNVYNAAAAIGVAAYLGMTPDEIRSSLKDARLPEMRIEKVTVGDVVFINDSYNANPGSFGSALNVLFDQRGASRRGVVSGDMGELGVKTSEFHRKLGSRMAERAVDFVVAVGVHASDVIEGAVSSGISRDRAIEARDHREAAEIVKKMVSKGTFVLLKGSRSARMEEVLKCFTTFCTP
ncbi:MAG: UDP-N-acetylmuramoyl-tripeptide--D-alanyl-D-alanine ligase [Candidatus Omnitrophica bacterium]|nr:UDP-N-acetylmuramoyl-tripeptide--D-alanyl-D-alanine ligase [Candidatus Omnitrophota bacterium]MDD4012732.1 UDP-N-acetylmuramoyl-tripeptide--D-alanyl-D-alanine ligase [Candidatus Omnitrophota bacterium]